MGGGSTVTAVDNSKKNTSTNVSNVSVVGSSGTKDLQDEYALAAFG